MADQFAVKRVTAPDIKNRKGCAPIVALTAYHAHTARIIDPYVDFLLVGDSLGMVMHGYETTVPVPLELMIMHAQAVVRGSSRALVVVDMPFGSYEESPAIAFRNAARVLKETGCGAIKLEGGVQMADTIRYLTERGIPVMSHIGMTPQAINTIGSLKPRGRYRSEWAAYEADAKAIADAGDDEHGKAKRIDAVLVPQLLIVFLADGLVHLAQKGIATVAHRKRTLLK